MDVKDKEKTILYIDDDYQSGVMSKIFLQKAGYDVHTVRNTHDARIILAQNKIDLIVTDIGMPKESGLEFYEWIQKSNYKKIPVLLISAHAMGFNEVLTEHRDIFFEKPLFYPDFIKRIDQIFGFR